jgi:hypothetical protein
MFTLMPIFLPRESLAREHHSNITVPTGTADHENSTYACISMGVDHAETTVLTLHAHW